MKTAHQLLLFLALAFVLAGCSKIYGVVTPNADGTYQAVNVGGNKPEAVKAADNDAKVYCKRNHGSKNYAIVEQDVRQDEAPDVDVGNKIGNALVQAARYADRLSRDDDFEVTTTFKCNG